ncbi:hypothetical protein RLOC_00008056 [Lonchura striata]|uniref:Uncharacterized protein n=1 Tax=Lonchura striata TaxID=40157 RepID=A0A218V7S2_9PASE|nr:hypothetical protein RLOC_00008056 [Lonchura striata domestica]
MPRGAQHCPNIAPSTPFSLAPPTYGGSNLIFIYASTFVMHDMQTFFMCCTDTIESSVLWQLRLTDNEGRKIPTLCLQGLPPCR